MVPRCPKKLFYFTKHQKKKQVFLWDFWKIMKFWSTRRNLLQNCRKRRDPTGFHSCKAESRWLSFLQSRILLSFIHAKPNPANFCRGGFMSRGIYILYISIYILIFYIMFIRKRFKAGEKNSGRFCQGDRENGNMRQNKENKKSPERLLFTYLLCIRAWHTSPIWYAGRWLLHGYLMAHGDIRLMLLHSCPDMVHGSPLHKTLISTFLTDAELPIKYAAHGIQPRCSGLRVQGTASSPSSTARIL